MMLKKMMIGLGMLCLLSSQAFAHTTSKAATGPTISAGKLGEGVTDTNELLKISADDAQRRCYEYLHDDATEYTDCLNAVLAEVKGKSKRMQILRLGIVYFAWVGANNSARLSLPGAEAAAQFYLPKFRRLQSQLKISDQDLCLSVAGECNARVASYMQMEKELQDARLKKSKAVKQ